MTQEPELVDQRMISGKGVLKPPDAGLKTRFYTLYSEVVRMPTNKYANLNYNPEKGRFGVLTFLRKDFVINVIPIEYSKQTWDFVADISGQTLIALKCAYEGILISFVNLGAALNAIPVSYEDKIKDYENLNLLFDEIRLVCYADTAIQLTLYNVKYDTCDIFKDDQKPPPPPPPPPPAVPPGTPISDISPPYDGGDNGDDGDDGNTEPFPMDKNVEPPPIGGDCEVISVSIRLCGKTGCTPYGTGAFFGPIGGTRVKPSDNRVGQLFCRGRAFGNNAVCSAPAYYDVANISNPVVRIDMIIN